LSLLYFLKKRYGPLDFCQCPVVRGVGLCDISIYRGRYDITLISRGSIFISEVDRYIDGTTYLDIAILLGTQYALLLRYISISRSISPDISIFIDLDTLDTTIFNDISRYHSIFIAIRRIDPFVDIRSISYRDTGKWISHSPTRHLVLQRVAPRSTFQPISHGQGHQVPRSSHLSSPVIVGQSGGCAAGQEKDSLPALTFLLVRGPPPPPSSSHPTLNAPWRLL